MTTTVAALIGRTRRLLLGSSPPQLNKLSASINTTDTTLSFTYEPTFREGAYLGIGDEVVYCWSVDASARSAVVERAQLGSTAASASSAAIVEASPRFAQHTIRETLREEIRSWPRTLYKKSAVTLTVATDTLGVDLTGVGSDFYEILEVLKKPSTQASSEDPFSTSWSEQGFRVERNLATSEYASGSALFLNLRNSTGYTIRVVYSAPFDVDTFTDATDLVSTVGLRDSMLDIPAYGAAWRLMSGRETIRTMTDVAAQARDANDVPTGAILRAAGQYLGLRDKRIAEEANKLLAEHPWRSA